MDTFADYTDAANLELSIHASSLLENQRFWVEWVDVCSRCKVDTSRRILYQNINGIVIVFDLMNRKSYLNSWRWFEEVKSAILSHSNSLSSSLYLSDDGITTNTDMAISSPTLHPYHLSSTSNPNSSSIFSTGVSPALSASFSSTSKSGDYNTRSGIQEFSIKFPSEGAGNSSRHITLPVLVVGTGLDSVHASINGLPDSALYASLNGSPGRSSDFNTTSNYGLNKACQRVSCQLAKELELGGLFVDMTTLSASGLPFDDPYFSLDTVKFPRKILDQFLDSVIQHRFHKFSGSSNVNHATTMKEGF